MSNILSKIKYYIDKPIISNSAIIEPRNTDFELVGATSVDLDKIPMARNRFNGIQYNQTEVSPVSCTVHGSATALSALTGITFTIADRKRIWDKMKADGTGGESFGGYVYAAVDAWREWWNTSFPDNKIASATVTMGSSQYYELIKKGYNIVMAYRGIDGYNQDWLWDGIVNQQWDNDTEKEEYGADKFMGHCLSNAESDVYAIKGYNNICVDNYLGYYNRKDNNIYGIDKTLIPRLTAQYNGIWCNIGYFFYFVKDFEEANVVVDKKLIQRLENRVVYNPDKDKFGIIKNGKAIELKGKNMSELFAHKWSNTNESYCLGLDKSNWLKIGLK